MRSFTWIMAMAAGLAAGQGPAAARPGITVLLTDSLHLVAGRRVGLLTNQTGVDASGATDLDVLRAAGIHVTALFSPEHGFRGTADTSNIGNAVDSATGVPISIFSLYGVVRAPTPVMLRGVDVLLIDLQDIGARPYTYISTAILTLQVAQHAGVPVVVLDRPDPIGGTQVQGPILDTALASFIGMLPVPLRHGMTMGELVRFADATLHIGARPVVVPVDGWRRGEWFDATGLPWVRPSPSMPNLESAAIYPGLVLFEATNLSVGRGTPIAFQVVAAPWLNSAAVRRQVGRVPGFAVNDTTITPMDPPDHKYPGLAIPALRVTVTDRALADPARLAIRLMAAVRRVHPDSFRVEAKGLDERAGTPRVRRDLEAGLDPDAIWRSWAAPLAAFRRDREPFLLYRR